MITQNIPISLYIHIPWCEKKCFYCDFNSYVSHKIEEKKYIHHLIQDLSIDLKKIPNILTIHSIFIGGGTPSLFHPDSIALLLSEIKNRVNFSKNIEITIESNPNTIMNSKIFSNYQKIGINRISIGVQSFNNTQLELLGRTHNKQQIETSINFLKLANFKNFNLDLMYNLPNQSFKNALLDLKHTISKYPKHISWYELSIEKNTFFYYRRPHLPKEKITLNIFKQGQNLLKSFGFHQYEISSYSKVGYQCQHNLNYWRYGDYIGIGCGAHGKITTKNGSIIRTIKKKRILDFFNSNYTEKIYKIKNTDKILEFFMNRFRLKEPILKKDFNLYTQIEENAIKSQLSQCISEGFIIEHSDSWIVTKQGHNFLNTLLEIFVN